MISSIQSKIYSFIFRVSTRRQGKFSLLKSEMEDLNTIVELSHEFGTLGFDFTD
jgi:hypothetical protein